MRYTPQLRLLRRLVHSYLTGYSRSPFLLQYQLGCDKEGSRAVQLLEGSSQDSKALLALTFGFDSVCDRGDRFLN